LVAQGLGDGVSAPSHGGALIAAQRIVAQLDAVLTAAPAARSVGGPLDVWNAAQAQGRSVALTYWSPESGTTERRVTPDCAEWQGDHVYLTGYCHERSARRTFRLDRVVAIAVDGANEAPRVDEVPSGAEAPPHRLADAPAPSVTRSETPPAAPPPRRP
ncbi:MAG: WYL domain-containing protein, partial [Ardenticatenales bacterium]